METLHDFAPGLGGSEVPAKVVKVLDGDPSRLCSRALGGSEVPAKVVKAVKVLDGDPHDLLLPRASEVPAKSGEGS